MRSTAIPKGYIQLGEGQPSTEPLPEPWREIDSGLLGEARPALPPFPLPFLPPQWERWVADTAQSAGAPVDYVAQGLFAAVGAVCGAGVMVHVTPAWPEPLVFWLALVGLPSSGKSPALAAVRRHLAVIEEGMQAGDGRRRAEHATRREHARLLTERWEDACAMAAKEDKPTPLKPVEAEFDEAFMPSQLVVADSTMEALADVVAGNPRGVILCRDELAAWLANLNRYANGGSDRAPWLEAWAAAAVTINRRSRSKPLTLRRFPVSVIGTIQPDRIAEAFAGGDDGLAARFLYAWPEAPDYVDLRERRSADDEGALIRLQRIARIAGSAASPLVLRFDDEAFALFNHFHRQLDADAKAGIDGLEAGWVGKGAGTVARLAGALALLAWSEREETLHMAPGPIDRETVQQAIGLWSPYFRSHARNVFNQAGRTDRDRNARRTVRWLRGNDLEEVSREQIRCEALCWAVDAEGADRVIVRLEQGGVLRPVPPTMNRRGRPLRRWAVNPALRSLD